MQQSFYVQWILYAICFMVLLFKVAEPLPCVLSEWTNWSSTGVPGTVSRRRNVITPATDNDEECGELRQLKKEPLPCVLSVWTKWSAPDASGTAFRHRQVIRPALNNGEECGELLQIRTGNK
ncbi:spondin-1-like [Mytilus trossulus]|uniref:spondin-1-like n=1 Tax=Mytilus trossulus TaxID=6551 RepID=UPI003005562B